MVTALLLGPEGLEPPSVPKTEDGSSQVPENARLTEQPRSDLADRLAEFLREHSGLSKLIEAWLTLPEDIRKGILPIGGIRCKQGCTA